MEAPLVTTIAARLAHRTPIYVCDLCNERPAIWHVHRIEGANVITATVCRECRAVWDGGQA